MCGQSLQHFAGIRIDDQNGAAVRAAHLARSKAERQPRAVWRPCKASDPAPGIFLLQDDSLGIRVGDAHGRFFEEPPTADRSVANAAGHFYMKDQPAVWRFRTCSRL